MSPVAREEFIREQLQDTWCQEFSDANWDIVDTDASGLLVRRSRLDGLPQVLVPESLRPRILRLEQYSQLAGHPGGMRLHHTLRWQYYWPSMALDCYSTVRMCPECAKNRSKDRAHENFLTLFPASGPLEFVAMDILGPLPKSNHGNRYLLVMTDRFSKLTKTATLRTDTALSIAREFCKHWLFSYGPPITLLTDNAQNFSSKLIKETCNILGTRHVFTTAYHPQTNGQAERFNRTILRALRNVVSEH